MRIFINNVDSFVGRALCADLRCVLGQDNRLFGTLQDDNAEVDTELLKNLGVKRVVSRTDPAKYLADIMSCSLVVYDLHSANLEDVEAVLKELKLAKLQHETTFVLISSANVWARTVRAESSYVPVERGEDEEEPAEEEGAPPPENPALATAVLLSGELKMPSGGRTRFREERRPPVLKDSDKDLRTPAAGFEQWKYLETLALSLGPKEKLRPHVVCAGMLYGNGETLLDDLFRAAWLTRPVHVVTKNARGQNLEPGTNYVPCVHVRDVARLVRVVAVDKGLSPYLIAVDRARLTQADLVRGIVSHISNALEVPLVAEAQEGALDLMSRVNGESWMDLILEPSAPMRSKDFDWWCKKGLVANLDKVASEFCRWRNLLPIKTVVLGPPGAGTERLGARIAERYLHEDPPHLTFDRILADALAVGAEVKLKDKVARAKTAPDGKLKLTTRTRLVRNRLLSNVCRFRGYVLEGYPSTLEEAKALFTEKIPDEENDEPPPEDEEESDVPEEEDGAPPPAEEEADEEDEPEEGFKETTRLNQAIAPEFVVVMNSSEERCKRRIFDKQAAFAGDEAAFAARTREYNAANLPEDGSEGPPEFFAETGGVRVLRTDADAQSEEELFSAVRAYLESKGSFFNYLTSEEELLRRDAAAKDAARAAAERQEKQEAEEVTQAEERLRKKRASGEADRKREIGESESAALEAEATPLRQYLLANVVPTLSEGLTEVCKDMPEDPIEALAQYLFAHAQDIAPQLNAADSRS
eukprot:TRINITY_DN4209_c2_g1_i1.p1 TRINITY_DN4209_c2_g1~~TRINITY_DN4209_c2_g1_i1.p1  ORF type:complete len:757 (-),score=203.37 TRINITY_DN4209_c2_g1_i1:122-2392(-)